MMRYMPGLVVVGMGKGTRPLEAMEEERGTRCIYHSRIRGRCQRRPNTLLEASQMPSSLTHPRLRRAAPDTGFSVGKPARSHKHCLHRIRRDGLDLVTIT